MPYEVVPPLSAAELRALRTALAEAGIRLDTEHAAYATPWRRTALGEAVDADSMEAPYALSPRSTRGATRA